MTFKLPEFFTSKDITWQVDMDSGKLEKLGYDIIIGTDQKINCLLTKKNSDLSI